MSPTRLFWAVAVVLAVVVIGMAYLDRRGDGEPKTTVMVAKQLIRAGPYVRPGTFDFKTVSQDEIEAGTLTDIRYIALHQVAHPIYPGEQFRTSDFSR